MSEYIKREDIEREIKQIYCDDCERDKNMCRACDVDDFLGILEDVPAVDVPEMVFCSECECNPYMPQSWDDSKGYTWCVAMADPLTVPHGYCIFGKRKDESK